MLNVYEQVDRNKKKSVIVIGGFFLFVSAFVWLLGKVFGTSQDVIILAILFSSASALISYFEGDKIILALSKAEPATKEKYFNFYTAAENLAIAAQIPPPKLYVIKTQAMNAFATGRDPKHATVCVTTGLLERLDKSEIEAVIGHEISHIVNYDIRLMTITAILVGMITILSDWIIRMSFYRDDKEERKIHPILVFIGILGLIFAPIAAKLIQLALSRRREYLADASAVKLTRQPQALINALKKLAYSQPVETAHLATAHLYIVNPFRDNQETFTKIANLFATHPPIEARIKNLQQML